MEVYKAQIYICVYILYIYIHIHTRISINIHIMTITYVCVLQMLSNLVVWRLVLGTSANSQGCTFAPWMCALFDTWVPPYLWMDSTSHSHVDVVSSWCDVFRWFRSMALAKSAWNFLGEGVQGEGHQSTARDRVALWVVVSLETILNLYTYMYTNYCSYSMHSKDAIVWMERNESGWKIIKWEQEPKYKDIVHSSAHALYYTILYVKKRCQQVCIILGQTSPCERFTWSMQETTVFLEWLWMSVYCAVADLLL